MGQQCKGARRRGPAPLHAGRPERRSEPQGSHGKALRRYPGHPGDDGGRLAQGTGAERASRPLRPGSGRAPRGAGTPPARHAPPFLRDSLGPVGRDEAAERAPVVLRHDPPRPGRGGEGACLQGVPPRPGGRVPGYGPPPVLPAGVPEGARRRGALRRRGPQTVHLPIPARGPGALRRDHRTGGRADRAGRELPDPRPPPEADQRPVCPYLELRARLLRRAERAGLRAAHTGRGPIGAQRGDPHSLFGPARRPIRPR